MSSLCNCPDFSSLATAIREDSFNLCSSSLHPKSPKIEFSNSLIRDKKKGTRMDLPPKQGDKRGSFSLQR